MTVFHLHEYLARYIGMEGVGNCLKMASSFQIAREWVRWQQENNENYVVDITKGLHDTSCQETLVKS